MVVKITITGEVVGRTWLYEFRKRMGRKVLVPTYRLLLSADNLPTRHFAVTRDTSDVVFGDGLCHFGTNGECPPSLQNSPYCGVWHGYGALANALRVFETGVSDNPVYATSTVKGIGQTLRLGILIHRGPARSEGCFTLAGGNMGYNLFQIAVERYLASENATVLKVEVLFREANYKNPLPS